MKTRNPRVTAHEMLLKIRKWTGWADATWSSPPSLRWYADEPGGEPRFHMVPRKRADVRPEEYPENNAEEWAKLARWAYEVELQATELKQFAREQERKVSTS